MKKIILFLLLIMPMNVYAIPKNMILMDRDTNRILYSKNIHEKELIASTTKIMTAVIAIESGKLDDKIKINDSVLKAYGSGIYVSVGETLTLRELVYGLMLRSGNDAALAIEDYLGGHDKFVSKMNEKAAKIGMKDTIFYNSCGLDEEEGNLSTAYDMALLMKYALNLYDFTVITSTKNITIKTDQKTYEWKNKNKLLFRYKYTTGGKTGYTKKAKRTLVTSASKNDINLIAVTFNDPDDFDTHKELYEKAFKNYKKYLILNMRKINIKTKKYKNKLYIKTNYYYLLKDNERNNISKKVYLYKTSQKNNKVGYIEIKFKNKIVHKEPIYVKVK